MNKSPWKYTLREIVIVIIGITIAFSMNKCAENVKNEKLKTQYLSNLKSDIEADKVQLQENIKAINNKLKVCEAIIPKLNNNIPQDMKLMSNIFTILKYENFKPKNIIYTTLINSGDLKLIEDFHLKTAIQQHYSYYNEMSDVYFRHQSLIKDYLGNYLVNYADYDQFQKGSNPFLDEIKLKNIVRALMTTFEEKRQASTKGIESCDELISEIEAALN